MEILGSKAHEILSDFKLQVQPWNYFWLWVPQEMVEVQEAHFKSDLRFLLKSNTQMVASCLEDIWHKTNPV